MIQLAHFLIISCLVASIIATSHDQPKVQYKAIGRVRSKRQDFRTGSRAIETTCETKATSKFSFGPCEEVCKKFDPLTFVSESRACAKDQPLGCIHSTCDSFQPDLAFSCQLNTSLIEDTVFVCPEDEIIFDGVNINTFDKITFRVDLDAPPVQTDVYLLADNTGSMGGAIGTAKSKAKDFFKIFTRPSISFGVGRYQDETELTDGFENLQPVTQNEADIEAAIDKWVATGGRDFEEANLVALQKIATEDAIGWRQGARRFIVLFGDAPGHEPSCALGTGIDRNSVITELKKKGITVVMVNFGNLDSSADSFPKSGCDGKTGSAAKQASEITEQTGGSIVSSPDQTQLVALVEEALASVTRTYTVDEEECMPFLTSVHTPALPLELEPSESAIVRNTVSLKRESICSDPDKGFRCEYTYEEGGAAIEGGGAISFINVKGCDEFLAD